MNPTNADCDVLTRRNLEGALLVLGTRNFQKRSSCAVSVGEGRRVRSIVDANAHSLERAGENELLDGSPRQITRLQVIACGSDLDFFGAYDGNDFVVTSSVEGTRSARIHGGFTEADAVPSLPRQYQVCGSEKGRDESGRRPRVQLLRLAHLQQPAQVHDSDSVGERERFFLVVCHQHRRDAKLPLHLADRAAAAPLGSWRRERRTVRPGAALQACGQAPGRQQRAAAVRRTAGTAGARPSLPMRPI